MIDPAASPSPAWRVAPLVLCALLALLPRPRAAQDPDGCLECHGSAEELAAFVDELRAGLVVEPERFERSVHAAFACSDCHFDFEEIPHIADTATAGCADCHNDAAAELAPSAHGSMLAGGPVDCGACHGVHDVMPPGSRASRTHPLNVTRTCGACHFEVDAAQAGVEELLREPLTDDSHAHGLLRAGLVVSASCVSCHGGHGIHAAGDPASPLARTRVAETCGSCHVGVREQYERGVHRLVNAASLAEGAPDAAAHAPTAAVCTDCHRPHEARSGDLESFRLSVVGECGSCHAEAADTYHDTFHGKLTELGGERAAKCHDCHGAHAILPPTDPLSPLAPANIAATCASCHEGAHASFAEYLPHATHHDRERWPWLFWAYWGMTTLLVTTMTVALLHTLLFLVRLLLERREWRAHQRAVARGEGDQRLYRRFARGKRTQHALMIVAFMTLALTGMIQKFSWTPWARELTRLLGGTSSIHVLHRIAALLLLGVFVWHVVSALREKRESARSWKEIVTGPNSILFNRHDLTEARETLRWFFGKGPRPRFGRFTYWEKFDYFAVFWGVAIIGVTGLALWFPVTATHLLPGWMLNVFTIVHGDEALLASAFIFTVHFFNANFRPDKFPMDVTIFTGRIKLAELQYERPREYDELLASGQLEANLVEPLPAATVRGFRVFASLALLTGVGLVVLIAYALLTA